MKCEHCGGNITLEAAYCPYCGTPNAHAQLHVRNMKKYQNEYEQTKRGVHEAAHKFTGITVRASIIAGLIIVIIALLILGGKSYEFKRMWNRSQAEKRSEEYMEKLDTYLENEEFLAFTAFCEEKSIDTYDSSFEKYTPVIRAGNSYRYVYQEIMKVACPPVYGDEVRVLESLSENLDWFYLSANLNEYEYVDGADNEVNRKALEAMEKKVALLLQTYCNLSAEEASQMKSISKAKRAIILEEAVLNE